MILNSLDKYQEEHTNNYEVGSLIATAMSLVIANCIHDFVSYPVILNRMWTVYNFQKIKSGSV